MITAADAGRISRVGESALRDEVLTRKLEAIQWEASVGHRCIVRPIDWLTDEQKKTAESLGFVLKPWHINKQRFIRICW